MATVVDVVDVVVEVVDVVDVVDVEGGGAVVGSSVNSVVVSLADSSDPPHAVTSRPTTATPANSRRFIVNIMVQCCRRDGDLRVRSARRSSLA
jgi:hypothetical protein